MPPKKSVKSKNSKMSKSQDISNNKKRKSVNDDFSKTNQKAKDKKTKTKTKSSKTKEKENLKERKSEVQDNFLQVMRLSENAKLPHRASLQAVGYDIYSASDTITISKQERAAIPTDLVVLPPKGCYVRVAPRSGLSLNNGIHVGAGIIDLDYRGNLAVVLFNLSNTDFTISRGDKIAQIVLEKFKNDAVVQEVTSLPKTNRGNGGFGSTGQT